MFAPLNKRALGVAVGVAGGGLIAAATLVHLLARTDTELPIVLLSQFFYGYSVSWAGVLVGFLWGFATGFVVGWSLAFIRNVFTALWLLSMRARGTLSGPFLDEI